MSWASAEDIYLSTSLANYLDKKVLVLLRDGRKLLGILRSFDQFGSCERVIVGDLYSDIPLGLYVIRGENVVLLGELDMEKEELPPHMTHVSAVEIKRAQKAEREATDLKGTIRKRLEFLDWTNLITCFIILDLLVFLFASSTFVVSYHMFVFLYGQN